MFLSYGVFVQAVLLVAGVGWCVFIIRRLPSDLAELRETYTKYRARSDPDVLGTMEAPERRRRYQRDRATDFWTTLAIQVLFFWPVTALVLVTVASVIWGLASRIVSAF